VRPRISFIGSGSALFLANNGKRFRPNKLSDMVSRYVKLAGIKRSGSCYLFRHATTTKMLDNGADLRHGQEMLGHADISTPQIYAHVSRSKLAEVYGKSHPSALSDDSIF
jgi:integrase/recombinase XerD